jgi:hypothetical protein
MLITHLIDTQLVRNLIRNILASRLLKHVSCAVGLPQMQLAYSLKYEPLVKTYNLLIHGTVLLGILAH